MYHVQGQCQSMCPASEVALRIQNKLVHRLEKDENGKAVNLVKEFRRSAAGHRHDKPEELRPPEICLRTTMFLIKRILCENELTLIVYHFIFDRLRSIRQDLIVQGNPDLDISIHILQVCVRFHLLSSYESSSNQDNAVQNHEKFDSDFNFTQLLECLKDLLVLYQIKSSEGSLTECQNEARLEAYGIYLIINLGSQHSIAWGLNLPKNIREDNLIKSSLSLNWLYLERNFVRFFRLVQDLPVVLKMAAHWNYPHLISLFLAVMNCGFSSKNCRYPLLHFLNLAGLSDLKLGIKICQEHNVQMTENGEDNRLNINFLKNNFKSETDGAKISHFRLHDIDYHLDRIDYGELFLLNQA